MDLKNRIQLAEITHGYSSSYVKSLWQLVNTFIPFFLLYYFTYLVFNYSALLTIPFTFIIGLFIVRIFCLQHDCGHGSFFHSRKANALCGIICSVFTLMPYYYWRFYHARHHMNSGKLEERGIAEYCILTTDEYLNLSKGKKFKYRFMRHPLCIFFLVPFAVFLSNLMPYVQSKKYQEKLGGAILFSFFIIMIYSLFFYYVGNFLLVVTLPAAYIADTVGAILFFLQHNFAGGYYKNTKEWHFGEASLQGSTYVSMPKILEWFTAHIGFHHIHHLNPNIPNYNLSHCHKNNAFFATIVHPLTLNVIPKIGLYCLWDAEKNKIISFKELEEKSLNT